MNPRTDKSNSTDKRIGSQTNDVSHEADFVVDTAEDLNCFKIENMNTNCIYDSSKPERYRRTGLVLYRGTVNARGCSSPHT